MNTIQTSNDSNQDEYEWSLIFMVASWGSFFLSLLQDWSGTAIGIAIFFTIVTTITYFDWWGWVGEQAESLRIYCCEQAEKLFDWAFEKDPAKTIASIVFVPTAVLAWEGWKYGWETTCIISGFIAVVAIGVFFLPLIKLITKGVVKIIKSIFKEEKRKRKKKTKQ